MANKNIKKQAIGDNNELRKFIKLIILVAALFLAFYLLTLFLNNDSKTKKEEAPATIQYDNILIGNIFTQPNDNYYVLVQKNDDLYLNLYQSHLANYKKKADAERVYFATLDNPFNVKFMAETTKITDDIETLRFNNTTLLYIQKGKVVKSYQTQEDITKILAEISKTEEESK